MHLSIHPFFDDALEISIQARDEDSVEGLANARVEGDALVLTFVAVRVEHRKRGVAAELITRLTAEARRRHLKRLIGERISSAKSWRLMQRLFGPGRILRGCSPEQLTEDPQQEMFAPSLGLFRVESKDEVTVEWSL